MCPPESLPTLRLRMRCYDVKTTWQSLWHWTTLQCRCYAVNQIKRWNHFSQSVKQPTLHPSAPVCCHPASVSCCWVKCHTTCLYFLQSFFTVYSEGNIQYLCIGLSICIFPTTSGTKYHNEAEFEGVLTNLSVYRFIWTPLCWSGCIFLDLKHYRVVLLLFAGGSWLSNLAKCRRDADKMQPCRSFPAVTMALLECPPPWNSMVPKASVGLSCVCLLIDHFSDRLSFLAKRSALSFWLDEMPGGRPTCWPIRRPQQHLEERRT